RSEAESCAAGTALGRFREAVAQRRRNLAGIGIGAVTGAVSAIAGVVLTQHVPAGVTAGLTYLAIGSVAATVFQSVRGAAGLNAIMREVTGEQDVAVIGPLVEIAATPDSGTQAV